MNISILTLVEASERLQLQPDMISERCAKMFCEHMDGPMVKTQPYLIVIQDRIIVGGLWTHLSKPDVAPFPEVVYIDMVIDEPFQKQGIGKRLGEVAISKLNGRGVPVVVFPDSKGGRSIARNFGFTPYNPEVGEDEQEWVLPSTLLRQRNIRPAENASQHR